MRIDDPADLIEDAESRLGFDRSLRGPVVNFMGRRFLKFSGCPICFDGDATSREHVPPKQLGGRVATLTCQRCNNEFGARFEADLSSWFKDEVRIALTEPRYRGIRTAGSALVRKTGDGRPQFVILGRRGPAVEEVLLSNSATVYPRLPSERRVRLALLKSTYLAVSIVLGQVIASPQADRIRELLIAARDSPGSAEWPHEDILEELRYSRTYSKPSGEITIGLHRQTTGEVNLSVGLAGTVYVKFPFGDDATITATDEHGKRVALSLPEAFETMMLAMNAARPDAS